MKFFSYICFALFFCFTALADGAATATTTTPDLGGAIFGLIDAVKVGSVAPIIVAAVQLLKTDLFGGLLLKINQKYIPIVMTALTVIGNVALGVAQGKKWLPSAIEGLFISGGAMAIYETVKTIKSKT